MPNKPNRSLNATKASPLTACQLRLLAGILMTAVTLASTHATSAEPVQPLATAIHPASRTVASPIDGRLVSVKSRTVALAVAER